MKKILSSSLIGALFMLSFCGFWSLSKISAQSAVTDSNRTAKQSNEIILKDGTAVKLRVNQTMSSASAKTGDSVDFQVVEDVRIGDFVVIPGGGTALGKVILAKPRGRLGKGGKLSIAIESVQLASGEKIPLRAERNNKGESSIGSMTGAIAATGIVFFPAAPLFLLMRGKDISIPQGTGITAYTIGDIPLEIGKFTPVKANQPATDGEQVPNTATSDFSTVFIKSVPGGAEISLDGKFVGSTPSTLTIKFGEHTISVKKDGYILWERTITITAGGNLTIDASLQKSP